jgi:hypothetical protein
VVGECIQTASSCLTTLEERCENIKDEKPPSDFIKLKKEWYQGPRA